MFLLHGNDYYYLISVLGFDVVHFDHRHFFLHLMTTFQIESDLAPNTSLLRYSFSQEPPSRAMSREHTQMVTKMKESAHEDEYVGEVSMVTGVCIETVICGEELRA